MDYSLTLWAGCQQTLNPSIPLVLHVSSVRSQGSRWRSAEDAVTGSSSLQFLQKTKSVYIQVKKKVKSQKLIKELVPMFAGCVLVILENIIEMELFGNDVIGQGCGRVCNITLAIRNNQKHRGCVESVAYTVSPVAHLSKC